MKPSFSPHFIHLKPKKQKSSTNLAPKGNKFEDFIGSNIKVID